MQKYFISPLHYVINVCFMVIMAHMHFWNTKAEYTHACVNVQARIADALIQNPGTHMHAWMHKLGLHMSLFKATYDPVRIE